MSAAEETLRTPGSDEPSPGPGRLLRAARERTGLSVAELAERLHLDVRRVEALEEDDYATLPAPAFVRGYLRSYARTLGIPVGPVMEAYDRNDFSPPPLVADIAQRPQAVSGDFPVRLVTWAIVGLLGALVVLWWHGRETPPQPRLATVEEPAATAAAPAAEAGLAEPVGDVDPDAYARRAPTFEPETTPRSDATGDAPPPTPAPDDGPAATALARAEPPMPPAGPAREGTPGRSEPATPGSTAEAADGVRSPSGDASAVTSDATPDTAVSASPSEATPASERASADDGAAEAPTRVAAAEPATLEEPRVAPPELGPAPEVSVPAPDTIAPASTDRLKVRLEHDSWVEVYDSREERLFYDLAPEGSEIDLRGAGPFRVVLGYARDVGIRYNGTPFDPTPFVQGEVARFTVGGRGRTAGPPGAEEPTPGSEITTPDP